MTFKHLSIVPILFSLLVSGCYINYKDLAKTLRHSDNSQADIGEIGMKGLKTMKRGESCTYTLLYFIPIYGDSSVLTAADKGNINHVRYYGETGYWFFPFTRECTLVFGDSLNDIIE